MRANRSKSAKQQDFIKLNKEKVKAMSKDQSTKRYASVHQTKAIAKPKSKLPPANPMPPLQEKSTKPLEERTKKLSLQPTPGEKEPAQVTPEKTSQTYVTAQGTSSEKTPKDSALLPNEELVKEFARQQAEKSAELSVKKVIKQSLEKENQVFSHEKKHSAASETLKRSRDSDSLYEGKKYKIE